MAFRVGGIREYECGSLSMFFEHVASEMDGIPSVKHGPMLLFRGQGDIDWALHPGLQVDLAGSPEKLPEAEKRMLDDFKKATPYLLPITIDNDWDRLSLAQHYGLRTRLLDWTGNPPVALWFALAKPRECDAVVWAFRPQKFNVATPEDLKGSPLSVKHTTVFRPTAHSPRVAMQAGWHTVHRYKAGKGLLAIDRMDVHKQGLAIFRIAKKHRDKVFSQLEASGTSVTTVFGDLASLCNFISARHCIS